MAEPIARPPLFTRAFVLLGVADLAYFTSVGIAIVALPLYVTGPIGSDEAGAGLAFGAFAITALLCRPFAGRYSDRLGRRPLLLLGAVLAAVGMLLMPYAGSLAPVVLLRLLQGVGEAAFFVSGFALLADIAPAERMGEALSYNSLGLYLGIAFGPPIGEWLLDTGGFTTAWVGAGVLAGVAGAVVLTLPEPERSFDAADEGHGRLIHRPALPLTLGFMTALVAMSGFLAFVALHADEIGMRSTSLALFVYGCVVVACRIVFARVPDRLPLLPLAASSLAVMGVGLVVIGAWTTTAGLLVGTVLTALGITFVTPSFFAAIFATARPSERGAASGTASAALDLGLGAGPIVLGLVARDQGIPWAFAVAGGVAFAGALWTAYLARPRVDVTSGRQHAPRSA
ncbi:MFS transporter [Nocardioides sp. GCM10027113]|uniref:MFS transporter n=1 Tax=unclassified Nocardioides TaxID=2615069 RepID=UPI00360EA3CA